MNNKIWFILFPLLAMLLCIYDRGVDAGSATDVIPGLSIAKHSDIPGSFDLQKNQQQVHKNKIRVKAKDAVGDMDIPSYWEREAKACFYANVTFLSRILYAESVDHPVHNLRGPPVA